MNNYLLRLSFLGTNYHGWQYQDNAITVQKVLMDAFAAAFGRCDNLHGCSRTDAGVHARDYAVSVCLDTHIDVEKFPQILNQILPNDIVIASAEIVAEAFHARYSCVEKEYVYSILNAQTRDPFSFAVTHHVRQRLDVSAMQAAAQHFVGTQDFSAFAGSKCDIDDRVRTISKAEISREGDIITFAVRGNGFLYNMVRIMAGTLINVGRGRLSAADVAAVLESKDREMASATAPAKGLCLRRVSY